MSEVSFEMERQSPRFGQGNEFNVPTRGLSFAATACVEGRALMFHIGLAISGDEVVGPGLLEAYYPVLALLRGCGEATLEYIGTFQADRTAICASVGSVDLGGFGGRHVVHVGNTTGDPHSRASGWPARWRARRVGWAGR